MNRYIKDYCTGQTDSDDKGKSKFLLQNRGNSCTKGSTIFGTQEI